MSAPANPNFPLPAEQEAIRAKCFHPSGTVVEFPMEDVETSIPARFEKIVQLYPVRLAVKMGQRALTYAELNQRANRVAHAILDYCGLVSEPVAVLCEDKIQQIIATLGALKAGKFYVPLDVGYLEERNAFFVTDSKAKTVLCDADGFNSAGAVAPKSGDLIRIDDLGNNVSDTNLSLSISPKDFAYIMYTSGSTGEPKGIIEKQENILFHAMCYTNQIHICEDDRFTLLHSLCFQASDVHFYSSLLNGASLFAYDLKREGGSTLAQWLSDESITIYHSIPPVLRLLTENCVDEKALQTVRLVHLSSATVTKRDWEMWKQCFPKHCQFLHRMGTTETQTVSWRFIERSMDIPGTQLPLGWPPKGKQVLILDEHGRTLGPDQVGQIAVKSRYISLGYWDKPELTKSKFLPVSGTDERIYLTGDYGYQTEEFGLFHLGRNDFLVKIRGHRIETSQIEDILAEHDGVKESVVVGHEIRSGECQLIAYVVPVAKPGPGNPELRAFLKARLPDYMVPTAIVIMDAFPLTPNGKLDRKALPPPNDTRPELTTPYAAPRNESEKILAQIWEEVLDVRPIGIHDNFFDLAGDSLSAMRVVARAIQLFRLDMPVKALFELPTVADMARVIVENQAKKANENDLERMLSEIEAISEEETQRLLGEQSANGAKL